LLLAMTRHRLIAALLTVASALLGLVLVVALFLHHQEVDAFAQAVWGPPGAAFWGWLLAISPVGRLPPFLIGVATAHIFMTRYGRPVSEEDVVTVVHFSAISERPDEIVQALRKTGPKQN